MLRLEPRKWLPWNRDVSTLPLYCLSSTDLELKYNVRAQLLVSSLLKVIPNSGSELEKFIFLKYLQNSFLNPSLDLHIQWKHETQLTQILINRKPYSWSEKTILLRLRNCKLHLTLCHLNPNFGNPISYISHYLAVL